MDIKDDKISKRINEVIEKDLNIENVIAHFVTQAQDYLVQQGILQSKKPSSTNIVKESSTIDDTTNDIHTEHKQTLTTPISRNEVDVTSASVHSEVPATDTVESVDVANTVKTKLSKYMSRFRVGHYKIPIAILSTVLGIGTIGGVYYATGSTDALDTMGSDTDTEVLNDTNDTAQRHGVCIATITACTVLLALCTTTAYWIRKQQQHDTTYSAMH